MLELLILGQPSLKIAGREVEAPTRKSLALLAYLAVQGPSERSILAGLLWSDLLEGQARRNLRRELARLRDTPIAPFLTGSHALTLTGATGSDLERFRQAVRDGLLEEAIRLYRGPLLDGLQMAGAEGFEEWLDGAREAIARERTLALTRLADEAERADKPAAALAAHLSLLRDDELQESHQREAMRLHALLGEREAALARYERFARLLKIELGLEPLPETAALAESIRSASPPPSQTGEPFTPTAFLRPPLIGREAAWAQLTASPAPIVLLHGEPGVGKSRLARDFAAARGSTIVLHGQEASSGTPYYPVAEALRAGNRTAVATLDPLWQREVARLAPDLAPGVEAPPGSPPPDGRSLFLEALTQALAATTGPGGTIILEDCHLYDTASSELVAHLARRAGVLANDLRVVATARLPELLENKAARAAIDGLEHDHLLEKLELTPLHEGEVLALVRALSGSPGGQLFSRRLHAATAGNPLFVLETIRHLFASGELRHEPGGGWSTPYDDSTSDYEELTLPSSVRDAVLSRVDRLGPAARRLLEAAALADDGFSPEHLTGATALGEWEAVEGLERAVDAQVLAEEANSYRFAHPLTRRALQVSLGPARKRLLHRRLADSAATSGFPPATIATHLELAGNRSDAVPWRLRAAEAATRVYAYQEALAHYDAAAADGPSDREAFSIHAARARLYAATGDAAAREREIAQLSATAVALADSDLTAEAALAGIALANDSGRYGEALSDADALLARPNLTPARASLAQLLAGVAAFRLGKVEEAEARLNTALAGPGAPPDRRADALGILGNCAMQRADYERAAALNRQALANYDATGDRAGRARALMTAGVLHGIAGRRGEALASISDALAEARQIGHVAHQRAALLNLSKLHLDDDDATAALPLLQEGLALGQEPRDPLLEGIFLSQLGHAHRLRGELGEALESLERAIELADRTGAALPAAQRRLILADLKRDTGDLDGARAVLREASERITSGGLRQLATWLTIQEAALDLASQDASTALERLAPLASDALPEDDRARVAWLTGRARLAGGDPEGALAALANPVGSPAVQARALAARLDALTHLKRTPGEDAEAAARALGSGRVPPLEAAELAASLARALQQDGQASAARPYASMVSTARDRLAASLANHPHLAEALRSNPTPG